MAECEALRSGAEPYALLHRPDELLPPRHPLSAGGDGDEPQAHRGRPHRVRPRSRTEPLLQLAREACGVVYRTQKPKARRGEILFSNAVNEVTRERAQSFLTDEHLQRVVLAYQDFKDESGFARVMPIEEIWAKEGNLSIPLECRKSLLHDAEILVAGARSWGVGVAAGWIAGHIGPTPWEEG